MIMRRTLPLLFLTLMVALFSGCSDDATKPVSNQDTGLIEGEIGDSDFEYTIEAAGPRNDPFEGPFILRGTNLHYDDELGALVVDLTVINAGQFAHHEPIGLTFIKLIPSSVTVLNPDNGIHGEGAAIVFQFANDDGRWTPGEASLPRTVQFGVEKGQSIGFVARLDIGAPIDGGTIAGRVWHDASEDGVMDEGEAGIPGVGIFLRTFDGGDPGVTREFRFTETGPDGRYAFDHLRAGGYVVAKAPLDFCRPTTPTEIHVLLVESNGDVSDFLDANFGCVPEIPPPPPPFGIGTPVDIEGRFFPPDVFRAFTIFQFSCPDDTIPPPEVRGSDDDPDCVGGRLRGPVTAVAPDRNAFRLMGTWVIWGAEVIPFDIQPGMRLDVRVHRAGNFATWVADSIQKWDGEHEQLRGRIDAVDVDPTGHIRILVLDTWITIPDITVGGR